jgi:hypothetical protein
MQKMLIIILNVVFILQIIQVKELKQGSRILWYIMILHKITQIHLLVFGKRLDLLIIFHMILVVLTMQIMTLMQIQQSVMITVLVTTQEILQLLDTKLMIGFLLIILWLSMIIVIKMERSSNRIMETDGLS